MAGEKGLHPDAERVVQKAGCPKWCHNAVKAVSHALWQAEQKGRAEVEERVGTVLSAEGCNCECEHCSEEHDETCELCLGCRIEKAMKGGE